MASHADREKLTAAADKSIGIAQYRNSCIIGKIGNPSSPQTAPPIMSQRYFSETPIAGGAVVLRGDQAHHLASVMRAKVGDIVTLFDGGGDECEASVARVGKREVELRIESRRHIDREANVDLTLAVAMPKSDRQKWLIEKAVELGVRRVVPLVTERSVVKLKESGVERLRRGVIEASKQCGRNRLMAIEPPRRVPELMETISGESLALIAHPHSDLECPSGFQTLSDVRENLPVRSPQRVIAAIGPEGGFSGAEAQAAIDAGWRPVSLGPRILRIETAALKIAASILHD